MSVLEAVKTTGQSDRVTDHRERERKRKSVKEILYVFKSETKTGQSDTETGHRQRETERDRETERHTHR